MDLLQNIRDARARGKKKQPLRNRTFNIISCIVKGFGLGEDFLIRLDQGDNFQNKERVELSEIKGKPPFEFPPFSLVSKEEYQIASIIEAKVANPYLQFAHSPGEILLSAPLYRANPSLRPEMLLHCDFETLLLCERAKEELAELETPSGSIEDAAHRDGRMKEEGSGTVDPSLLHDRIRQLQTFIKKIERTEPRP